VIYMALSHKGESGKPGTVGAKCSRALLSGNTARATF